MARFRKKPIEVEATQWWKNGDHPDDYKNERDGYDSSGWATTYPPQHCRDMKWEGEVVRYFRRPDVDGNTRCQICDEKMNDHGWIDTLEGGHIVCPSDWVITGVAGERYPCKDSIFRAIYEAVAP